MFVLDRCIFKFRFFCFKYIRYVILVLFVLLSRDRMYLNIFGFLIIVVFYFDLVRSYFVVCIGG